MPAKNTTLDEALRNSRNGIRFAVVAGFLLILSFLTFAFVAFDDTPSSQQSPELAIPVQPTPTDTKLVNDTYNFTLSYPSNLRTEIHVTEGKANKKTQIGFGTYTQSLKGKGNGIFEPHVLLSITENVAKSTSAEKFLKLDKKTIISSKEKEIDGIKGTEIIHSDCQSKNCYTVVFNKMNTMYEFSYQNPDDLMYRDEFSAIISTIKFSK